MAETLGRVADITSLFTFAMFVVAWFTVLKRYRPRRFPSPDEKSVGVLLITGAKGHDCTGHVENYLRAIGYEIDKRRFKSVVHPDPMFDTDVPELHRRLLEAKQDLSEAGVGRVWLFTHCPLSVAVMAGAMLDNWVPVFVFQQRRGAEVGDAERYECWLELSFGDVREQVRREGDVRNLNR